MQIQLQHQFIGQSMVQTLSVVSEEKEKKVNQTTINFLGDINVYLPRLTSEHSGVYTCVVENAIGKVNQSIYLDVECKFKEQIKQNLLIIPS